jgi:hypothetical protein
MSFAKSILLVSAMVLAVMAVPAEANSVKTVYTGLSCVPHYPQPDPTGTDYVYEYYGSDIINTHLNDIDPVTGDVSYYYDLGVNCAIDRTLFGANSKLRSVSVLLQETDPTTWIDQNNVEHGNSNCHTHVEYLSGSYVDVLYGDDVYTQPGLAGGYQTLSLPATAYAPDNDANYDIHCHIYGEFSSINGYTVVEKN